MKSSSYTSTSDKKSYVNRLHGSPLLSMGYDVFWVVGMAYQGDGRLIRLGQDCACSTEYNHNAAGKTQAGGRGV